MLLRPLFGLRARLRVHPRPGSPSPAAAAARSFSGKLVGSDPDRTSDAFRDNDAKMRELVSQLRARVAAVAKGGGDKAIERHKSRGKLVARDRIDQLLDPASPFLELSQMAAFELYGREEVPAGGIITGIGRVKGSARKIFF